jgi:hypothetical protein
MAKFVPQPKVRMQTVIFGRKRQELHQDGENYVTGSFVILFFADSY